MLSRGGDIAVAETVGNLDKNTNILIMGTLAQHIRLIRKLRRQPLGDCQKVGAILENLLFKVLNVDLMSVW